MLLEGSGRHEGAGKFLVDARDFESARKGEHEVRGPLSALTESLQRRCPRLVVLITTRERLAITGELTYRVSSLSLPGERGDVTPQSVAACESARLFADGARLHLSGFEITRQNATALAHICRRLDGMRLTRHACLLVEWVAHLRPGSLSSERTREMPGGIVCSTCACRGASHSAAHLLTRR